MLHANISIKHSAHLNFQEMLIKPEEVVLFVGDYFQPRIAKHLVLWCVFQSEDNVSRCEIDLSLCVFYYNEEM